MITVIGIFENMELAAEARSYLLANDFTGDNIDIHSNFLTSHNNQPVTHNEAGFTDKISEFFSHLFDDEDEAALFTTAGHNGIIVTVHAASVREAQEAVDVLNYYGAVDVNEDELAGATGFNSRMVERKVETGNRLQNTARL